MKARASSASNRMAALFLLGVPAVAQSTAQTPTATDPSGGLRSHDATGAGSRRHEPSLPAPPLTSRARSWRKARQQERRGRHRHAQGRWPRIRRLVLDRHRNQDGQAVRHDGRADREMVQDPVINEYVNRIGQNLVRNSDARCRSPSRSSTRTKLTPLLLPGGFFYVNSGLILAADEEAELAGVMAHEIAHVCAAPSRCSR